MTVDQMRAFLGLGLEISDADVVTAFGAQIAEMELVTLDEAKLFLRIDQDYEDEILDILIAAACEAALIIAANWNPADPVPARMKLAILTHVARAYRDREDGGEMPIGSVRLLDPLRVLEI